MRLGGDIWHIGWMARVTALDRREACLWNDRFFMANAIRSDEFRVDEKSAENPT